MKLCMQSGGQWNELLLPSDFRAICQSVELLLLGSTHAQNERSGQRRSRNERSILYAKF